MLWKRTVDTQDKAVGLLKRESPLLKEFLRIFFFFGERDNTVVSNVH